MARARQAPTIPGSSRIGVDSDADTRHARPVLSRTRMTRARSTPGPTVSRGPSMTRTASVSVVAPRRTRSRASERNSTCLYGIIPSLGGARDSRSAAPPRSAAVDRQPYRNRHHRDDGRRDEPLITNRLHHGVASPEIGVRIDAPPRRERQRQGPEHVALGDDADEPALFHDGEAPD